MIILITDSCPEIAKRLCVMIKNEIQKVIIYEADNYDFAIQLFKEHKPAVVLLAMNPNDNGPMELLLAMKESGHKSVIFILSIMISTSIIEQCKLLGATIFLDKFLELELIPEMISGIEKTQNN